jgi:hypothetical protein
MPEREAEAQGEGGSLPLQGLRGGLLEEESPLPAEMNQAVIVIGFGIATPRRPAAAPSANWNWTDTTKSGGRSGLLRRVAGAKQSVPR